MLEGNLKEFSFAEILKLVGDTKKTGAIKLRKKDGSEGFLYLKDGNVYFASSNFKRKPLGERLVEAGKINRKQLEEVLQEQRNENKKIRLGMILVDKEYISPQVLVNFVQEQIIEAILDFFTWEEGSFLFIPGKEAKDEDIGIQMSIENVILKGSEKLENWRSLKKFIKDKNTIFDSTDIKEEKKVIVLRPKELKVLRLVNGERTIKDLLKDTMFGEFELYRILFGLYSAGLIEKVK